MRFLALIFIISTFSFADTWLPSQVIKFDGTWVQLADQWLDEESVVVGTIMAGDTVCFDTLLTRGSGGDLKIEGPNRCVGDTPLYIVDEALKLAFPAPQE